jgi:H+/Cl- antiporter ClcA
LGALEEGIVMERFKFVQELVNLPTDPLYTSLSFFVISGMVLVAIAAAMTIWFGPGASGSGIAELMSILNGVNVPEIIGFKTLITKIFGTVLAVSGGLCIGKEGPLAHIGANIGVMVSHMPVGFFRCLHNDVYKR